MTDIRKDTRPAKRAAPETAEVPDDGKERVAKVMARAGLCSRRDAEAWIKEGRVAINGATITSPALNIGPDDVIAVDGHPVTTRERTRLFMYHKPRGLVTTARDPEGRPTVFDALPPELPRLISVGRLDINTEGLLLLTNDGGLARVLELPATGWLRRYRVRANGFVSPEKLHALKDGITIDGIDYAGIEATLDRAQGANVWLTMGLREGKNREIKRVLEHLGLAVNRLIRLSFGPFQLGDLKEGAVEEVRQRILRDQLGETLAAEAGVAWEDAVQAEVVTRAVADRKQADAKARPPRAQAPAKMGGVRAHQDEVPQPRQDRPAPRARPHVSALRAERPGTGDEPRKRITRKSTEDRHGRTIAVERVSVEDKARHRGEGGTSRNARNFARERREAEGGTEARPPRAAPRSAGRAPAPAGAATGKTAAGGNKRAGGFSSERPMTGRAVKDGKFRAGPKSTEGRERPARGGGTKAGGFDAKSGGGRAKPGGTSPRPGGRTPRGRG
ncbi:pseudouridine synthase [Lichenifustis flavocetrariae]|uniref:Pseudouridine synthase n=1 Tax=Lichenifustis flavocetrariae TaxID=2949735 RepID=A0AA41YV45_9HYPH|nr:pseudouridine synthase [Lichenifustis flavocetrariae]MCW6508694.1 rRNA pseudouridine synthase [Lichenifustis flavocetrariae]